MRKHSPKQLSLNLLGRQSELANGPVTPGKTRAGKAIEQNSKSNPSKDARNEKKSSGGQSLAEAAANGRIEDRQKHWRSPVRLSDEAFERICPGVKRPTTGPQQTSRANQANHSTRRE